MKTRKLYAIREMKYDGNSNRFLSSKLRERKRATKLKNYIAKRFKIEVYTVAMNITTH